MNDILIETPGLRINGDWHCLNIETNAAWPTKPQSFIFEGLELWVMPYSTDSYPGIAVNRPSNLSRDDTWSLLHRALSLLSWVHDSGAMVIHMSGGDLPRMMGMGKTTSVTIRDEFDLTDLPIVADNKGRLALALMREGRGLNHPAYAFLSFFRALETAIHDGKQRKKWVTDNIDNIQGHQAKEALKELRAKIQGDIGEHLRDSGRHAIAHARDNPIINPDDPRDAKRLRSELPIIQALAVLAIEQCLGIQTSHTVWKEHLYELRGWKPILGDALIKSIMAEEPTAEGQQIDAPIINVRLRRRSSFIPFEGMKPLKAYFEHGKVQVVYQSTDGLVNLVFTLNFVTERLEFDIGQGIIAYDDGSAQAACNYKEITRFNRDYCSNGELQMWDSDTGQLISRCGAFIPRNCFLDINAMNAMIARWDAVIEARTKAEAAPTGA